MKAPSSRIRELHTALRAKKVSAVELLQTSFKTIEARDPAIGAFLALRTESARHEAQVVDAAIGRGETIDLLAGIPLAMKDNILIKGERTTAASKILAPYTAAYDATVVARLKARGAVCVGKTNLDEFAMGSSTEHSALGRTVNPLDFSRVPGGSSGGSAAAVAAGFVPFALGSDTCGSIRQPSAFCGVVGFKPTYGRVSRFGLVALASSFDQIGPITHSAEDAALVLSAIAGQDSYDATSLPGAYAYEPSDFEPEALAAFLKGLCVGVPKEFFPAELEPAVAACVQRALDTMARAGASIKKISLPTQPFALPVYYVIMPAEASSNLARYDGMRYGFSVPGETLRQVYEATRGQGFGQEPQRRIMLGTYVLSAGYYDTYYGKATEAASLMKAEYQAAFEAVDVVCGPTAPTTAFKLGAKSLDPVAMYLADIFMALANLTGAPAISVPCGAVGGLPVGLQIMARPGDDQTVLQCAAAYELLRD